MIKTVAVIIIFLVVIIGAYALLTRLTSAPTQPTNQQPADNSTPNQANQPDNQSDQTVTISIQSFAFNPSAITIPTGTTVTWTNNDSAPHTVTSNTSVFNSSTLQTGQKFSFRFLTPGTYSYYCAIHPSMTAKIIVQ